LFKFVNEIFLVFFLEEVEYYLLRNIVYDCKYGNSDKQADKSPQPTEKNDGK